MEENLSKPACIRANSLQEEGKRRGEGEDLAMEKLLSLRRRSLVIIIRMLEASRRFEYFVN